MRESRTLLRRPLGLLLVASLVAFGGFGCNDEEPDETPGSDATSGGEEGSPRADLEAPPGSREPGELPDGDLERDTPPSEDGADSGSSGSGEGGTPEASAPSSPWGDPETETGAALPPRREMSSSARSHYQRGLQLAGQGNDDQARQAFQQALDADSNAYKAAYNLGVMAARAGDDNRAMQFFQQSLRIQADYERAIEGIARVHIRRGNAAEAVSFVRPLADRWVRNLHVQAVYGDVLVAANRPEEAIQAARRALRRDERFVPAMVVMVKANLKLERTELAESILDQAIETSDTVAELHFLRGQMHREQGNLQLALQSYQRAIELEPAYLEARMAVGLQNLAGGNYPAALQHFQVAVRLAPNQVPVRLALGDAYRASKQWTKAKAEFDRVQEMDSRNAQVHYNLGLLYLGAEGDFPGLDTVQALQRAVAEFNRYRELMGSRLPRNDPSQGYLEELGRMIEREQRRVELERARAQREAERAARQAQEGGE